MGKDRVVYPCTSVCLSGLVPDVDKSFLEEICNSFGKVKVVVLRTLERTGKSSGVASVEFTSVSEAKSLCEEYDHETLLGGKIRAMLDPGGWFGPSVLLLRIIVNVTNLLATCPLLPS